MYIQMFKYQGSAEINEFIKTGKSNQERHSNLIGIILKEARILVQWSGKTKRILGPFL